MKYFLTLFTIPCFLWLVACGGESTTTEQATAADPTSEAAEVIEEPASATADVAVCLWDKAGLREDPGSKKGNKYLATVNFGEVVSLTGEVTDKAGDDRTYVQVQLSDGKIGWVNEYLFALQAERAAALKEIAIYKRPELTTVTDKQLELGDIFAVKESDKPGWVEVAGFKRGVNGWARVNDGDYSVDEVDVTVAILMQRAINEGDMMKREEALSTIASNSTFQTSALIGKVDEALAEIQARPELPANQLYITADKLNVRSEPDNEADNVVFQLASNDICTIIERGERVEIREMNDYWYKIEKDGQEGWIYGYFTSKRLSE